MIDIAIIGAGPAGYSAAITARKRDQSVVVIGQNTGWLARAEHVANYPGLPDISGRDLLSAMANQAQALGAELRPGVVHQVIAMGDSSRQGRNLRRAGRCCWRPALPSAARCPGKRRFSAAA